MDLGLHTTLDDTESILDPEVIAISERINPLMAKEFGKVWDLFTTRTKPFETDEYEVLSRNYTAPEVSTGAITVDGSEWNSDSDITELEVTAATIDRITIGDVLLCEDEIVVVASVDRSGNTIDVYERGAGESTAVAHTGTITMKVIGNAHEEGKVQGSAMAEQTAKVTNYCQLVQETVDLSKADTDQARKTGRTEVALKSEAMERVMRDLARSSIFGTARVGTATYPAMTRGLINFLTQVSGALQTNVAGAFTEVSLKNALDDVREAGGTVNAIVMNVANKRLANAFTGADAIQVDRGERMGGHVLDGYIADGFGSIPFVVDIDMPNSKVALVNSRYLQKGWKDNDQLRFEKETNVGSRERKETLQGKFGLSVEQVGKSHAVLTGLTTS